MTLNILATATEYGFAAALVNPIKELQRRGHNVTIYATGTEDEAKGFGDLGYDYPFSLKKDDAPLLERFDLLLTGLSGQKTGDAYFVNLANRAEIPSIALNMQNGNYLVKLGEQKKNFPTIIAQMDEQCLRTVEQQIPGSAGKEAAARSRVVGWTMFDHYAAIRDSYTPEKRIQLLDQLKEQGITLDERICIYLTQHLPTPNDNSWVAYEKCVTEALFAAANELRLTLAVKPHPREDQNYIAEQTKRFGHIFVPFKACKTPDLILAADAVFAGRSTALTEACLLDRNTAGILPHVEDLTPYTAITTGAIPYADNLNRIDPIMRYVIDDDDTRRNELAEMRKRFSVDGKASQRLADLVEELVQKK